MGTVDGALVSPRLQAGVTRGSVYRACMRYVKAKVDDKTHEHLHTIAERRRLTVSRTVRLVIDHYLTSFPLPPLEGRERLRLQRRGAPLDPSEGSDEISFLDLFDELAAQEASDAS